VIASGGRYDLVYKKLGMNKKSVGFSYYLQQLEKILDIDNFTEEKDIETIKIDKKNGETTFIKAIDNIKSGRNIEIIY
jgi:histidyl-tRNA synthetase